MTVTLFDGKPRTGKGVGGCIWAYDWLINQLKMGYKREQVEIFSNYKLTFADKNNMDVYDVLEIPLKDVDRHPKLICLQEVDKIFDSWVKNEDMRMLSSFAGQSGKRNIDIQMDSQFYSRIQKVLRKIIDYKIVTASFVNARTKRPLAFEYTIGESLGNDEFGVIAPPITLPTNTIIHGKMIDPDYFNMYDSYEVTQAYIAPEVEGGND